MEQYFIYGETELACLSQNDPTLGLAITRIGHIERALTPDLFPAVVNSIAGQQITSAAHRTIWARLTARFPAMDAASLAAADREALKGCGLSYRKADYIQSFARCCLDGLFDLAAIPSLPDAEVIQALSAQRGIGVWTAEMLLIFCLSRPDVVSYGDFGIRRGMRMLYQIAELTRGRFDEIAARYRPYGTVASLYLWAIAGGALPELTDPAVK